MFWILKVLKNLLKSRSQKVYNERKSLFLKVQEIEKQNSPLETLKSLKSKIYKKFIFLQFLIKLYRFQTFGLSNKKGEMERRSFEISVIIE